MNVWLFSCFMNKEMAVEREDRARNIRNSSYICSQVDKNQLNSTSDVVAAMSLQTGEIVASAKSETDLLFRLCQLGIDTADVVIQGMNQSHIAGRIWRV